MYEIQNNVLYIKWRNSINLFDKSEVQTEETYCCESLIWDL